MVGAHCQSGEPMTGRGLFRAAARPLVVALLCVLLPGSAFASGFFHPEVGARSMMRGGATIAGGDDLSCLYVNVANLAQIDGTNLYMNNAWDIFHTYYRREPYLPGVRNYNPFDPIQFAGMSTDFGLKTWTFGFGVYGSYGVTNRWPVEGPQRYNIIESNSIQIYYSLAAAWNPTDWLRIGMKGSLVNFRLINYYGFTVLKDRNPAFDVVAKFDAKTDYVPSWGAGIVVAPLPGWFELAFSYLPEFNVTVVGTVSGKMPDLYAALLEAPGGVFSDNIRLPLHYPPIYRGAARFIYKDKFDVEAGAMFIPWTMLPYYDVDVEKETVLADFKYPLQWQNTWNYRLGGTYRPDQHWRLHAGYQYEDSANPPEISGTETDKQILGGGITASWFGIDIDLGYAHVFQKDVETPPSTVESPLDDGRGRYKTSYDVLVTAFNINFERIYEAYNGKRPW
jgi:long-subunit fatty acid transport protein